MKLATIEPTMPSTVVMMKPLGLLGPGNKNLAISPAMKPMIMMEIQ